MNRQEKYPDTFWFTYYNANPCNRLGGDCVIRAICTALDQTWKETVYELTEITLKTGFLLNDPHCYEAYLKSKGWVKKSEPRYCDNTKMLIKDAIGYLGIKNAVVTAGSHHVCAIKDGKVRDIWDSSKTTMHTYWVKGE